MFPDSESGTLVMIIYAGFYILNYSLKFTWCGTVSIKVFTCFSELRLLQYKYQIMNTKSSAVLS